MNKTTKLHVQNTIWLVSPPSSAKQQRESFVENAVVSLNLPFERTRSFIEVKTVTIGLLFIDREMYLLFTSRATQEVAVVVSHTSKVSNSFIFK